MAHNKLTNWEKACIFPITVSIAIENHVKQFIERLKKDESGLEIVQVVLIVLVGVLLIAGLWAVLGPWISQIWDSITQEAVTIEGNPLE